MKPRPPTLRTKKRYILARIDPPGVEIGPRDLYYSILESLTSLFGDVLARQRPVLSSFRANQGMQRSAVPGVSSIS